MKKQYVRLSLAALISLILLLGMYSAARLQAAPPAVSADQHLSGPTRLLRYPDISKDKVVFSYAGDLWTASRDGGAAVRLTASPGDKLYPKFSPDGKWIAFTASYDGNPDVYIIPTEGGEPKRITFHPAADIVLGWSPDGKNVLFRSDRDVAPPSRTTRLYLVSTQGGLPKVLPVPRGDLTSFSPDGTKIA
jgi:tricorn protease